MGAASKPVRRLAFGVAWWCAMVASCTGPAGTPSTTDGQSRGEQSENAGAGAEAESAGGAEPDSIRVGGEAGAPGERHRPVFGAGAGTQDPSVPEGGSETGEAGGRPSVLRDPSGGEAAGADGGPACGKQPDGTMCGSNMSPPGPDGARYFCSSGEIIAEAACPGACDSETNACVQSDGTGTGTGGTNLYTLLRCRACYATLCRAELVACDADPLCTAHLGCYESCSVDDACYSICDGVFAAEPLLGELNKCVGFTGCVGKCPH